jgi:hypothetical protein
VSFVGFDLTGARRVRVTSYSLGGTTRSEVLSCVVEVEYERGAVEHSIVLEPDTMSLAAFEAFVRALNRRLGG